MAESIISSTTKQINDRLGLPIQRAKPVVLNGANGGDTTLVLDYISSSNFIRVYAGGVIKGVINLS